MPSASTRSTYGFLLSLMAIAWNLGCFRESADFTIERDIEARLHSIENLNTTKISIRVRQGVITLRGQVPTEELHERVVRISTNSSMANRLNDQIRVAGPGAIVTVAAASRSDTVNVNEATEFELQTLPGVSPADAETIIENRPYRSPEELLANGIVTDETYDKIKTRVVTR